MINFKKPPIQSLIIYAILAIIAIIMAVSIVMANQYSIKITYGKYLAVTTTIITQSTHIRKLLQGLAISTLWNLFIQ